MVILPMGCFTPPAAARASSTLSPFGVSGIRKLAPTSPTIVTSAVAFFRDPDQHLRQVGLATQLLGDFRGDLLGRSTRRANLTGERHRDRSICADHFIRQVGYARLSHAGRGGELRTLGRKQRRRRRFPRWRSAGRRRIQRRNRRGERRQSLPKRGGSLRRLTKRRVTLSLTSTMWNRAAFAPEADFAIPAADGPEVGMPFMLAQPDWVTRAAEQTPRDSFSLRIEWLVIASTVIVRIPSL